jgi:hypothetical protein
MVNLGSVTIPRDLEAVELARGIEPPTCGLQKALEPFSDPSTPSSEATESLMEWPG